MLLLKIERSFISADKLQAVDNDLVNRCHKPTVSHESVTSLHSAVREAEKEVERRYKMIFEQWKLYELTKVKTTEAENSKKMVNYLNVHLVVFKQLFS